MGEVHEAQILQPVALRLGHREQHRAGQRAVPIPVDLDRAGFELDSGVGRGRERGLGHQLEHRAGAENPLAEGDRGDMPLPHRAQRHDDADRAVAETRLIGVRHDAGVHQRGGGVAVFMAEERADQLLLLFGNGRVVEASASRIAV